ncbi:hypothetical protein F5148DRAFT_1146813 [Russula earlei]|uniref:Uncharacterized protein n=1 Tax=Russula earlei TaxID=71964 RepID=A0ACC0UIF3_9AGAM|nr:hypothetical protein F5148DRAFT_1146813 [Russula earlei]
MGSEPSNRAAMTMGEALWAASPQVKVWAGAVLRLEDRRDEGVERQEVGMTSRVGTRGKESEVKGMTIVGRRDISLPEDQMVDCLMHPKSSGSMMQMIPNLFNQVLACNKVVNVLIWSNPMQSCKHKATAKCKQAVMDDTNTDADDTDFTTSSAEYGSEDPSDFTEISNEEIADMLPSKTILEVSNKKGHMHVLKPKIKMKSTPAPPREKARTCSVEVEEIDNMDSPCWMAAGSFETPNSKKKAGNVKRSPVYLFYKVVSKGSYGSLGEDGNPMYQLYCILKNHDKPPVPNEITITSGKQQLNGQVEAEYMRNLEKSSENIKKAFEDQFEQLLTEWVVACDQPFDKVEKPEFINLMNFTHHTGPLKILKHDGIKQRVVKMGKETIEGLCEMFSSRSLRGRREYGRGGLGNTRAIWSHWKNYHPHNG